MINRSGLIKFDITKDSIKTQKVFTDFKPKGRQELTNEKELLMIT